MEEHNWEKLKELIQSIKPKEFEKLIATLLTSFLQVPFVVARSGDQPSGDARDLEGKISIQAKRYTTTNLDESSIVGEIYRARGALPSLQVYVLALSRDRAQSYDRFDRVEEDTFLDIVVLELTDELSDIGALCVTYWADFQDFQKFSKIHQDQDFFDWMEVEGQNPKTKNKIKELQRKVKQCIQTQIHFQKEAQEHFLRWIGVEQNNNPRAERSIDLSIAKDRPSVESSIGRWWKKETEPVCYLEGEKNSGKTWLAAKWVKSVYKDENMIPIWLDSNHWRGCESLDDLLEACFKSIYGYQVEKQILKLKHKICNTWDMPTLIILDGLSERESIKVIKSILDEYFEERHIGKTKWGHKIRLLLTTRPFNEPQSSKNYLWKGCHRIHVEPFSNSESQATLTPQDLQPAGPSNLFTEIAEIPRYSQICTQLQDRYGSFDPEMVLWANLLEKIEHTDSQVRAHLGWSESESAQEILARLAKQTRWTNVDTATQFSVHLLKKCFSDYRETRHDLEEQRVAFESDDIRVKVSQDHIVLSWALYLSNLFDCQEFVTIKDFIDCCCQEIGQILSSDPRTEALFISLQISEVFPKISQKPLLQKRAALISMVAQFNNYNPQLTNERLLFWAEQDTEAYARAVEFEVDHHNNPNYEEALIAPLATIWLGKGGQINRLESRLKKWLLPTHTAYTSEDLVYKHVTGQRFPRKKVDVQFQLLDAALSILSQRTDPQFLEILARCYAILLNSAKSEKNNRKRIQSSRFYEKIGRLMRWRYTETKKVLDELCSLVNQSESDTLLLEGAYRLADSLHVNLPKDLERPLTEEDLERRSFVEKWNRRFKPYIDRIRNKERLLVGDSPAANGNYHGLDYLAVRTDLPDLHHEDILKIKKILKDVSLNAKLGRSVGATREDFCIENLMPWVAKCDSDGYAALACALKLNALNQKWAQFKLGSIPGIIFKPEDRERITEAILGMKQRLVQDIKTDDSSSVNYLASLLTETLLFSASEEQLIDWFEFLASYEPLRISIDYKPLADLLNELLPKSVVKFAQKKLEDLRFSVSDNQTLPNDERQEFSKEEFWCMLYAYAAPINEETVKYALEDLKMREPDSTGTFPMLRLSLSDPKLFLDEILIDEKIQEHLFSDNGKRFIIRVCDVGKDVFSYEVLRSYLPPEIVGSFLCSPDRRDDLSRWGRDLKAYMCSILQGAAGDPNSVDEGRFEVNPEVLRIWAEQNTIDFLQLADEYLTELSKSLWYDQVLSHFTNEIRCLLLRFQPAEAMRYYRQWKVQSFKTVYRTHYGVQSFIAQLWQIEDCNSPEHHQFRCELLEECLNDEEIMFMTLAALAGKGEEELWNLVTEAYLASPYAKERNLGVSILPWFGNDKAIEGLEGLKSEDPSRWVREHAAWTYEVAQQERSCREVYREALKTRELSRISAVFEQIKPALSPTARWWHREIEKEIFGEEIQDIDSKLAALVDRFWYQWGNSSKTKSNIEIFRRKLKDYCRGEKLPAVSTPRLAPWWKPSSD